MSKQKQTLETKEKNIIDVKKENEETFGEN
jgi:hypothetical protein